jgi:hypothetical protein
MKALRWMANTYKSPFDHHAPDEARGVNGFPNVLALVPNCRRTLLKDHPFLLWHLEVLPSALWLINPVNANLPKSAQSVSVHHYIIRMSPKSNCLRRSEAYQSCKGDHQELKNVSRWRHLWFCIVSSLCD